MSETEARQRLEKKMEAESQNPESVPYFVIVQERYYLGMWCLSMPEPLCRYGAKNGDLVIMVYRKLDTLTDWILKLRFRYHLGPNPADPYSVHDKKNWTMASMKGKSEVEVEASMEELLRMMVMGGNLLAGGIVHTSPADFLELRCQGNECIEKMKNANKDWLHMKEPEQLEKDKWFSKLEKASREDKLAREVEKAKPGQG